MSQHIHSVSRSLTVVITLITCQSMTYGQSYQQEPVGVEIERHAISLRQPDQFRIPLRLEASQRVHVVARMDGEVNKIFFQPGAEVRAQSEVIRFDAQERSLELQVAQADHELAKLAESLAGNDQKKIAAAQREVARKKLDLAEYRSQQTVLHAPMTGVVSEVFVAAGEYVRTGEPLMIIEDPHQLSVDIPIERDQVQAGAPFSIHIDGQLTEAKVEEVLPALRAFDPLRELFVSVATAQLLIDASSGSFQPGQGVTTEMIPRYPIAEVPVAAIKTDTGNSESERMIQVIRDGFVRTLPIQLLGQFDQTHAFVSARFIEGDEVIVTSSEELQDGSWVRPMLANDSSGSGPANQNSRAPASSGQLGSPLGPDGLRRAPIYNRDAD